jgi:hypothetical protein
MKNYLFAVRQHKNARQTIFLPDVFSVVRREKCVRQSPLCRAPEKTRRQRSERMANVDFPRILCPELLLVLKLKACDSSTTCNINNPNTNL